VNATIAQLAKPWKAVESALSVRSKRDYATATERLNALLDDGADAARHPLHGLLHALGLALRDYEERHIAIPAATPQETLAFLMQQHGLKQGDLPDVGPQSTISDLLNGRRAFHARHILALSRRFGVPADAFMAGPIEPDNAARVHEQRAGHRIKPAAKRAKPVS
jgi:HTH-type transcriptional regulator / antitoxin HigA